MTQADPDTLVTQEIQITDASGAVRLRLSARTGEPKLAMLAADGHEGVTVTMDDAGRPSIHLSGADAAAPTAKLEIDAKGAHVRFDLAGGAAGYLFLNNQGGSGVVLFDGDRRRRLQATLGPDGDPTLERFGPNGEVLA